MFYPNVKRKCQEDTTDKHTKQKKQMLRLLTLPLSIKGEIEFTYLKLTRQLEES